MKRTILLLGGARSGKSTYAQKLAEQMSGRVLFTATATAGDADMRLRIEKHKKDRPAGWSTLEAPLKVGQRISENIRDEDVVIIDCLTLLVNNIFCSKSDEQFDDVDETVLEEDVVSEISGLNECIKGAKASFIIVSNEVGLGLVPDNRMGRLYRDILGKANQMIARSVDEVYFMAAGIPVKIKP